MSPLLGRSRSQPGADAARGEALVLSGDSGISGATQWTSLATLQVTAPGLSATSVTHECMVDRGKELIAGFTLPINVDPDDPNKLSIIWDEVPTIQERIANRDPVILDPEATWKKLHADQRRSRPGAPMPSSPWSNPTIEGWPPGEGLKKGRQAGTAWVIAASADARNCQFGDDSFMPPGRTHYRYKGTMSYGPHAYLSWLLLRVNPEYAEPYGAYFRTKIVRWRFHPVLPVSINPDDPTDLEICWDAAPNLAREIADRMTTGVAEMHQRVDSLTTIGVSTTAAALANIADPAVREQAAQMMGKYGIGTTAPGTVPTAAAPSSALDRLDKLRASGVLTDAEFETERAKLAPGN